MQHVLFGRSGLRVSELCLGTMTFGDERSLGSTAEDSRAIFDGFASAGGTFLDTADHYANGESERILGEYIVGDRDNFVLATKWSASRSLGVLGSGNSRRNMLRAVEASLGRLRTDRIDLYLLHLWDFTTPWEEILRAFDDLVRSGKVLYVGISDTPAWEISRAQMLSELRGWNSFAGIQIEYSLAQRTPERELLPMADELGLAVTAWSPLAGGVFSGKYKSGRAGETSRRDRSSIPPAVLSIADEVDAIADEAGVAPSTVAIAWVKRMRRNGAIIPILGARTPDQLKDNLSAASFELPEEAVRRLDEVSRIELGFPHDLLRTDYVRSILVGGDNARLRLRTPLPHPVADLPMTSGVSKG